MSYRLIHIHDGISLLMLAHTGSTIVSDGVGVVVGLVVSEDFQHPPLLSSSICL